MKLLRQLWPVYLVLILGFCAMTYGGSRAVTVLSELPTARKGAVFLIDAGHGGEDGGTVSCTGVAESRINLEIAHKTAELLRFLGREAILTRPGEEALSTQGDTIAARKLSDLKNRVRLINQTPRGVLVSIHQNQFPDPQYSGPQVFWGRQEDSKPLAQALQQALVRDLQPEQERAARPCGRVYLLEKAAVPAILIECGFLSNPREEALLRQEAYQKKLSAVIAAALIGFEDHSAP